MGVMDTGAKRILIFSTAYGPFWGGAEVAVREITNRIGGGFEFELITARLRKDLPNTEKIGRITVHRLGNGNHFFDKILLPFRGMFLARKLNKRNKYDAFWCIMASFGAGAAYLHNIFFKKVPIVLTLQEGDSEVHLTYKWFGMLELSWRAALARTTHLTAISAYLLNRARSRGFKGSHTLVPNGVDVHLFSKTFSNEKKQELKNHLGKKEDDVFLVTTSRLTRKNGLDTVIEALPLLSHNVSFIVLGVGKDESKLKSLSQKLKVQDRVRFIGFVPYEEIPHYLAVSDIFIRPSRSEGFGNSFVEAMLAGLPVVGTPIGGIVDFLEDKKTGVFCEPNNPESIVKAVELILDNSSLRDAIIEDSRKIVKERYDWDRVGHDMEGVFRSL